ncbi:type VI secretion system Vgr family protein [Ralstonia pickettii]|uniref:Type VI secretion system tip protein VgrG n=2 Tax=Ralstonia TaxID=48736 RepID=A0A9Q2CBX8_RALPI|nr:type VI secretion system Vgr family protein [Ralstonia pickettii]MBA9848080.1 type VI secretion system tip protein VgrG [Ralstonia pickettii]MBA9853591.1 type VI secretion system tip protein VgrG [Ralstonia pickettii]MBA9879611.1 type VI secretion system tip protein VgrG [Ralstonia pickettii]MBA9884632.1 type VI secretion system tip protein VgrG [Ralstonia pickettii]MBA9889722.1 type VI secretion system tip protein VgrG [Ralstonia pickettii]
MGSHLPVSARTASVSGPALPDVMGKPLFTFVRLQGTENLCSLYEYEVELKTPDKDYNFGGPEGNFDLRAMNGRELTVRVELDGMGTGLDGGVGAGSREISGIVDRARYLRAEGRHFVYGLTLRPWLWIASQNRNSRIFENKTDIEVIEEVLSAYNFPVERRLDTAKYPRRIYRTQADESDYAFIARLMEHWGISWFFEHVEGKHRLILADMPGAYRRPASEAYHTLEVYPPDFKPDQEHLDTFAVVDAVVAGKYTTSAYSFTQPRGDLTASSSDPRDTGMNSGNVHQEVYDFPSEHAQPATDNRPWNEGDMIARIRMEAVRSRGLRCFGTGNLRAVIPGHTFVLQGHPQKAANREYVVIGANLTLEDVAAASGEGQRWHCRVEFECHPTHEIFRPARDTPWPVITGPQSATVVGPDGHVTHADQYGRVRVEFPWDRFKKMACWMRVSTSWAGSQYGQISIPRIGTEVLVSFLDGGNPDKPIITGAVANSLNMPPWRLPDQHVLTGIRTREHEGSRSNHLVFDDTKGQIQAQLSSDHLTSQISMGYLTGIPNHAGRQDKRGEGLEARTDGHASLRAALGLLLTTHRRDKADGGAMSIEDVIALMQEALTLADSLAQSAVNAQAQAGQQKEVAKALRLQAEAIQGGGKLAEFREPHIAIASQAGIATSAPGSTHVASGEHIALTSGQHLSFSSGGGLYATATERFSLFVQRDGIKLFSAKGKVEVQAQSDAMNLVAQKVLRLLSTTDWVEISGKKGIRLNVGGNEIRITPEGIENLSAGKWAVYSGSKLLTGPKAAPYAMPTTKLCTHLAEGAAASGAGAVPLH